MSTDCIIFQNLAYNLEFRLSILGYQFPHITTGWDANWLVTRTECDYNNHTCIREDPSLLTSEIQHISTWFRTISHNNIPRYVSLGFLEPNIEFILYAHINERIRFGIKLDFESKPPFTIEELTIEDSDDEAEFVMIFEYSCEEMSHFADKFKTFSETYPQRGEFS